jgi:DNA topoisomerase VI subunit B
MESDFVNITDDDIDDMIEYAKIRLDIQGLSALRTEQKRREQEAINKILGDSDGHDVRGKNSCRE